MKVEDIEKAIALLTKLQLTMTEIDSLRAYAKLQRDEGMEIAIANNTKRLTVTNREDITAITEAYIGSLCRINDEIITQLKELGVTI